ncbi:hypothetical protein HAZT_HAZT003870 [Hyalella azteca]|uniref:Gamma-butyrobetaine hydroxylase-like N-terminal domain-containing protein n=1 Tax=Hyalella azteca TaxID=294128 RepID=A0A6A0GP81_HYAAZ|nr:hypothetical protein HAZT_HAZT003870 [Hyalella azteca]
MYFGYPTVWLRDNCQCSNCFNPLALGRSFLMQNLLSAPEADDARLSDAGDVEIRWKDGHESVFKAEWLQRRAFTEQARQKYRSRFSLPKRDRAQRDRAQRDRAQRDRAQRDGAQRDGAQRDRGFWISLSKKKR